MKPRPTARTWRITVEFKRRIRDRAKGQWTVSANDAKDGSYRVAYLARVSGAFRVRALYGPGPKETMKSTRQFFLVG